MRALRAPALLLLLLLGGCAYLMDSPFPAYVPLMVDQVDVSDDMPYDQGGNYELRVVSTPAGDLVWLYGVGTSFAKKFLLFDSDLHRLLKVKEQPGQDTFSADCPIFAAPDGSWLAIGTVVYTAMKATGTASWGQRLGYYDPSAMQFYFPVVTAAPDSVQWNPWSDPMTPIGTPIVGGTISGGAYSYNGFEAMYQDLRGGRVALYARPSGSGPVQGWVGLANGFEGSLASPMILDTRAFSIDVSNSDIDRPQFAGSGTVIRYNDDKRLVFYDLKGREGPGIFLRDSGDVRVAFSPAGQRWYVFDPALGKVMKARTWW